MCIIEVICNKEIADNMDFIPFYSPVFLRKNNKTIHSKFDTDSWSDFLKFL